MRKSEPIATQSSPNSDQATNSAFDYRHPRSGLVAFLAERILNSSALIQLRRLLIGWLPFVRLKSDVTNVVYLNWVIPAESVAHLVPDGVRLLEIHGKTILSVLTYKHGHFAPAVLGPLRRLFPSPHQSNWRLYVDRINEEPLQQPTVLFFMNCTDSLLYAAGARMFSDTLPCHLARAIRHSRTDDEIQTTIDPGDGSAAELTCTAEFVDEKELPAAFRSLFTDWNTALEFLCYQDAAVCDALATNCLAFSEIGLPIDISQVQPLAVKGEAMKSKWLASIVKDAPPFCFVIERVQFQALSDKLLK
jgi:hypothetical protein